MIIKSFVADSASAALRRVRKEMGGEAIVLKTRQLIGEGAGGRVEVTACLESSKVGTTSAILADEGNRIKRTVDVRPVAAVPVVASATTETPESDLNRIEQKIDQLLACAELSPSTTAGFITALREADVAEEIIDELISRLETESSDDAATVLTELIEPLIDTEVTIANDARVLVVGMAGTGKSSVVGKLAARLVAREKKKVTLSTLDEQKIAAHDEMFSYAAILGIELSAKDDKKKKTKGIRLIDSPALSARVEDIEKFRLTTSEIQPTLCFATISAMHRTSDIRESVAMLKSVGATHIAATMTDLTSRWGALVSAAYLSGLKIAFMTDTPGGMGDLVTPTARVISDKLLSREAASVRS